MRFSIVHKSILTAILLVLFSVSTVGWVFYSKTTELLVAEALHDISNDIRMAGSRLQAHIEAQNEDTIFLANTPPIQGMLRALKKSNFDKQGKSTYQQWVHRQQSIFQTMLKSKAYYLKLRVINKNGQELIVIGRDGSEKIKVLSGTQLQNKAHRDYMRETLQLPVGKIFLSEFNLNREHGKVSQPQREVLRTATPIYDERNGEVAGLLVITAEVSHELREIQNELQSDSSNIYITNDRGSYLLHPDSHKSYGFDLGEDHRIQEEFPHLSTIFLSGNQDDDFILQLNDIDGKQVINFTKIHFDLSQPQRFIAVGMTELYSEIIAKQSGVLTDVIYTSLLLAVVATLLAIWFSFRLLRPIKQITQVIDDYAHQGKTVASMPVNHNDEIGVLARSFETMIEQVEDAQNNLNHSNKNLEAMIAERTLDLEMSEMRQRSIVENIVDGLITIDDKGLIQSFNSAAVKIFGYQVNEVKGHNIKMLMPEPYHSEHDGYLNNYHQTGKNKIIGIGREVEGLRKDGSTFPLDLAVSKMIVNGETIFTGVVRDITERKQIDKMKNEFISMVSHELRTPLTSIRGSLGLLCSGTVGDFPESANEMLKIANNNSERLLLLINDILDIQKIESGKMNFKFESVELHSFIEQAIIDHAEYGKQHGVTYVLGNALEGVRVFADKDRLMQVMGNLLSNAAKFSNDGDNIEISVASHQSDRLRISVTDFGLGISEEFQPKLFDRFTQSDSSDTRAKGGTGLGLSIAKVIIEKHGGLIGFISKEGIGSTFYIELPELMGQVKAADSAICSLPDDTSACVLIVEDDPDVAALIRRMLTEAGFNSDIAYDAKQARLLLAKRKCYYRLMTLDISLPDEDGISLLASLRKNPETKDLPVVVLSVKANEAKRELQGGALDVVDWLSKPIDHQRLIDVVSNVLADNKSPRVLHVEDEKDVHAVVNKMLDGKCELLWTTTVAMSRELIKQGNIDLVLLDIGLPDGSGLDLLEDIERLEPQPQVVIFSALDVSEEYANRVDAVLVKSKTNNEQLLKVLVNAMK
jgi:PAS domain S-box-containing protein